MASPMLPEITYSLCSAFQTAAASDVGESTSAVEMVAAMLPVARMVKANDAVAGMLARRLAIAPRAALLMVPVAVMVAAACRIALPSALLITLVAVRVATAEAISSPIALLITLIAVSVAVVVMPPARLPFAWDRMASISKRDAIPPDFCGNCQALGARCPLGMPLYAHSLVVASPEQMDFRPFTASN